MLYIISIIIIFALLSNMNEIVSKEFSRKNTRKILLIILSLIGLAAVITVVILLSLNNSEGGG